MGRRGGERKKLLIGCGVLLAAALIAASVAAETVPGTVYAAWKDGSGAVNAVVRDVKGNELRGLKNKKMEVTGAVSKNEFSSKAITVTSFKVIE